LLCGDLDVAGRTYDSGVSATAATIVLRPSRFLRVYGLGFGALWCAVVITGLVVALNRGSDAVAIWALLLLIGVTIAWRTISTRVELRPDEMRIRNFWATTVVLRGQIEDFRIALPAGQPFGRVVYVLVRGPFLIAIEASRATGFGGQAHTKSCVQQLNAWLASPEDDPI